jgi:hypothetical protein
MNKQKTIIIIVSICTVIVVFLIIVFMKSRGSPDPPDHPDPPICKTEDCIKQDPNSSCVSNECKCNNCSTGTYPNCKIDTSKIVVEIENQPEKTIQLVNYTREDPLHIFLSIKKDEFTYKSGCGKINKPIDFTQPGFAWDPLGSVIVSEVMIPKNKYIILNLPADSLGNAFRVSPMKMKSGNDEFLKIDDTKVGCPSKNPNSGIGATYCKIAEQWPVLLEGGMDVVADASAVDGINFKLTYQLTAEGKILTMDITQNPCDGLDDKYQLDVGCRNPVKIDCGAGAKLLDGKDVTADCCTKDQVNNNHEDGCISDNQVCRFNDCSLALFNISDDEKTKYYKKWDNGNNDPPNVPPVKTFIENPENLKDESPTKNFCTKIHEKAGDFTPYCYDYNDTKSSKTLGPPYKMKLIVSDLV